MSLDVRTDGAAVECPTCLAKFGGMDFCPWDGSELRPLADADPAAVAFYAAIKVSDADGAELRVAAHYATDRELEECGYHDSNVRSSL